MPITNPDQKKQARSFKEQMLAGLLAKERNKDVRLAQDSIERAINASPTGEAREALTTANIFLTYARDLLAGKPTTAAPPRLATDVEKKLSLHDNLSPGFEENARPALQQTKAATFRTIYEEGGVISPDEADVEQFRTT